LLAVVYTNLEAGLAVSVFHLKRDSLYSNPTRHQLVDVMPMSLPVKTFFETFFLQMGWPYKEITEDAPVNPVKFLDSPEDTKYVILNGWVIGREAFYAVTRYQDEEGDNPDRLGIVHLNPKRLLARGNPRYSHRGFRMCFIGATTPRRRRRDLLLLVRSSAG